MSGMDEALGPATAVEYEAAKDIARDGDAAARSDLASQPGTPPEILYYLAEDPDPTVREAVAANPSTPVLASEMLVQDVRAEVRAALARRLPLLLPNLDPERQARAHAVAAVAVERLAVDHAAYVRQALSETLKDVAMVPPPLAFALARDVERVVAEPILRFCASLSDGDLLKLIEAEPQSWRVEIIAQRPTVSGPVSDAVVRSGNEAATGHLLENPGADIPEPTFEALIEEAIDHPEWQEALARRPVLPRTAVVRLASFAERSVLALLQQRDDFDPETTQDIAQVMRRRLDWIGDAAPEETSAMRAARLFKAGGLDEAAISDALAWEDREFVVHALALRTKIPTSVVEEILKSDSPRAITALAWHAKLPMRLAIQLQARLGGILPRRLLNAKNGTDYPLGEVEMIWNLELFGIQV
ncbi:MAG TPA: DUF2336 domain-containing protein [Azospirillaceae bacterium]|nr:DUF2336 domain-containing protein [Azospirillaceae bacterium]